MADDSTRRATIDVRDPYALVIGTFFPTLSFFERDGTPIVPRWPDGERSSSMPDGAYGHPDRILPWLAENHKAGFFRFVEAARQVRKDDLDGVAKLLGCTRHRFQNTAHAAQEICDVLTSDMRGLPRKGRGQEPSEASGPTDFDGMIAFRLATGGWSDDAREMHGQALARLAFEHLSRKKEPISNTVERIWNKSTGMPREAAAHDEALREHEEGKGLDSGVHALSFIAGTPPATARLLAGQGITTLRDIGGGAEEILRNARAGSESILAFIDYRDGCLRAEKTVKSAEPKPRGTSLLEARIDVLIRNHGKALAERLEREGFAAKGEWSSIPDIGKTSTRRDPGQNAKADAFAIEARNQIIGMNEHVNSDDGMPKNGENLDQIVRLCLSSPEPLGEATDMARAAFEDFESYSNGYTNEIAWAASTPEQRAALKNGPKAFATLEEFLAFNAAIDDAIQESYPKHHHTSSGSAHSGDAWLLRFGDGSAVIAKVFTCFDSRRPYGTIQFSRAPGPEGEAFKPFTQASIKALGLYGFSPRDGGIIGRNGFILSDRQAFGIIDSLARSRGTMLICLPDDMEPANISFSSYFSIHAPKVGLRETSFSGKITGLGIGTALAVKSDDGTECMVFPTNQGVAGHMTDWRARIGERIFVRGRARGHCVGASFVAAARAGEGKETVEEPKSEWTTTDGRLKRGSIDRSGAEATAVAELPDGREIPIRIAANVLPYIKEGEEANLSLASGPDGLPTLKFFKATWKRKEAAKGRDRD